MLVRSRGTKTSETRRSAFTATTTAGAAFFVALLCLVVPAVLSAQTPPPPPPRNQAFEDSIRAEIRLRQERLTQLRDTVHGSDDAELEEALTDLQDIIDELEGELSDIQVQVDENTILFSNTSGDLRIEIPEDIGQRVSEGISAVTATILGELPDSVDFQREIERFQQAASGWNLGVFGETGKEKPKKIIGEDMFAMRKDLLVNEDERVTGDVIVLSGDATVLGEVDGTITVIGGELILGDESMVHGEVNILLGELLRDDDAVIDGDVYEISGGAIDGFWGMLTQGPAGLVVKSTGLMVLGVLLLITLAITPDRRLEAVHVALTAMTGRSFIFGALWFVLGHLLMLVVIVVLVATVIGIPLALLLALAYLLLGLLAVGMVARLIGRRVCGGPCADSTLLPVIIGLAIISIPGLLGAAIRVVMPDGALLANLMTLLGLCIHALVYCLGSGAVFLSRFGGRAPVGE
jgi:hypothetical protein